MPVVKATIKDIVKAPVGEGTVTYVSYDIRAAAEGGSVITAPGSWAQPIVNGVALTPSLDPGLYEVEISIGWFVEKYNIVVPATETEQQLKTLIDEFIALPPDTPAVRLAAAIGSYFAENPVEGAGPSQENVAPLITSSGATRTAVDTRVQTVGDTRYAPTDDPRFDVIASGGAPVISTARDANGRPYIRITQAAPELPGKVAGVAVVPGNDTAAVSWTDLAAASGYDIEHVGSTGSAVIVQDSGSPLTLSGLPVGSRTVRVRAYNAGGAGEWSDPVTVTVGPIAPGKVTGVTVTPGNKTASVAYGTPSGTITTFRVREKLTSGSTWNEYTDAATPLVVTTSANGSHDFQVRAENGSAAGEWSDVVTVTLGAVNGVVASDNMNRSGDLVGSSPVVGPGPWSGTNAFTLDGTRAVSLGTGQLQYLPLAARGDVTIDANVRVGTQETATKALRTYLKFPAATDTLYLEISCKSDQTSVVTLNKRIGNTITVIASFPTTTLPANTAPADYAVQISVVGLNVSGTVNGTTRSGTLLQSEADTLAASQQIAIYSTSTNHSVDSLSASVNGLYV